MISHICIGVNDFERAFSFYSAVFEPLGFDLKFKEADDPMAGWTDHEKPGPMIIVTQPLNEQDATPGNGQMTAFQTKNREAVRQCYSVALANGGSSEGEPGLRPHYHEHYYGAYFRDPDGNKICVCCHDPEDGG